MSPRTDTPTPATSPFDLASDSRTPLTAARGMSVFLIVLGALVLFGWYCNFPVLTTIAPKFVAMKAMTALSFVLLGMALATPLVFPGHRHTVRITRALSAVVIAIAVGSLVEHIAGIDLLFNRLLPYAAHSPYQARMGPNAAVCFILLGVAAILLRGGAPRHPLISQGFAMVAGVIALTTTLAYLFSAPAVESLTSYTLMAVHTAVGLLVAAVATLLSQPAHGLMPIATNRQLSGSVVRLLLLTVFVATPFCAYLRLRGQQLGWYGTEYGLTLFALSQLTILSGVIAYCGSLLRRVDRERLAAQAAQASLLGQLRDAAASLETKVTERTTALQESEERFRRAFDYAAIGMAIVSLSGRWVEVNRALTGMLGYSEEELLQLTFQDITFPSDLASDLSYVSRLLADEIQTYHMEKRYFHKSGRVVWALLNVSLVRNADGVPLHFLSQIQDITARKDAEDAVRESEERFQLVVRGMYDGIWDWNVATGYCYFSPRYAELLGYEPHELNPTRSTFELHLHPDDREGTLAMLRAHFDHRIPYNIEYRLRTKSGEYRWFQARGQALWDDNGVPIRFAGALHDITKRRDNEDMLRQTAKLLRQTELIAKIGGWERDLVTNVPRWSDTVREIVEVDPSFQPNSVEQAHNFYAPEARPVIQAAVRELERNGTSFALELPYITAKGRRIWVRVHADAERRDGKVVRVFGTLQDITSRKQAELAVEHSEKFLQAVIEAIPQPVFVKDREHRWVLFNDSFCQMMGRDRAELYYKSDPDVSAPELVERYWAEDDRAFENGEALMLEDVRDTRGSTSWMLKSKKRVDLTDAAFVVGIMTDITSLKATQEALSASEEAHRLLADNSSDMITRLSPSGGIDYASPASVHVLGTSPYELMGCDVPDFIHAEDREDAISRFLDVVKNNEVQVVTCRLRHKELGWVWAETSFRAVRESGSRWTQHVIGVTRNVDERVRVTRALDRFKQVLDNTVDMIFMYDVETLRYTYVNRGAARALGYSQEEMVGMGAWWIRYGPREDEYRAAIAPLLNGEIDAFSLDTIFRRADGTEFPVDALVQFINRGTEAQTLICIARDATERKKVDRMKNEFVSTVSHELRTPLTAIRGSLGLIAGGAAGGVSDQARNLVRIAHNNTERLVRLINDILDIEKIESGKMQFNLREHALSDLLEQAIEGNASYAQQLGVALKIKGNVPICQVRVDADRFQQVMSNLLANAAKFSPKNAVVDIEATLLEGAVQIAVRDYGAGVPEAFRDKLFEKFSQADGSNTRAQGGTGLGLAIAKSIAETFGGAVWLDDVVSPGARFVFELPLAGEVVTSGFKVGGMVQQP